jgi:hypothetical protein
MTILELIRADADGIADRSGKTALDSQIEEWRSADVSAVAKALEQVVASLDKNDWKQWRALRQIIWRLNLKNEKLRDDLAVLTEGGEPANGHARFYAYLARADLGNPASMDELMADTELRDQRPSEWLQLALNQASPRTLHLEYLKLASKLSASDFTFMLSRLRDKYGDQFVEWMTELCRAMPLVEASQLSTLIDEEYRCGIYNEILLSHPTLRTSHQPSSEPVRSIWDSLPPDFKDRATEKAQ